MTAIASRPIIIRNPNQNPRQKLIAAPLSPIQVCIYFNIFIPTCKEFSGNKSNHLTQNRLNDRISVKDTDFTRMK